MPSDSLVPDLTIGVEKTPLVDVKDVDVDGEGNIFVLNVAKREVKVFDNTGRALGSLHGPGGRDPGFGQVLGQVLVGPDDRVYVPDVMMTRVAVFRGSTRTLLEQLDLPNQTTFFDWALGATGELYVSTLDVPLFDWLRSSERGDDWGGVTGSPLSPSEPHSDMPALTISRLRPGRLRLLLSLSRDDLAWSNDSASVEIFGSQFVCWAAVGDGTFCVADALRRTLLHYSSEGRLNARYALPLEPEALRPPDRDAISKQFSAFIFPKLLGRSHVPPDLLGVKFAVGLLGKPFTRFLLDSHGYAWLGMPPTAEERSQAKSGPSVFDLYMRGTSRWSVVHRGEQVGSVVFPEGFKLTRVRGSRGYGFRVVGGEARLVERYRLPRMVSAA